MTLIFLHLNLDLMPQRMKTNICSLILGALTLDLKSYLLRIKIVKEDYRLNLLSFISLFYVHFLLYLEPL